MCALWTVFQVWIFFCGQEEIWHAAMCACADANLFILNLACILLSRALCVEYPSMLLGLFVWAVCSWLCRESCCVEKVVVHGKLLFWVSLFGNLAGCSCMLKNFLKYPYNFENM
jgi:hypothetical protein